MPWAKEIAQAAKTAHEQLTEPVLRGIVELVPDAWLEAIPGDVNTAERRAGYLEFFMRRLEGSADF